MAKKNMRITPIIDVSRSHAPLLGRREYALDTLISVLECLGSTDLAAVAATSPAHRELVVGHLHLTRSASVDVCEFDMLGCAGVAGVACAVRGRAIAGVRLMEKHLLNAARIRLNMAGVESRAVAGIVKTDNWHTERAVASTIRRNAGTLFSVCVDSVPYAFSILIFDALAACRNLDSFVAADLAHLTTHVGMREWQADVVERVARSNAGLRRLKTPAIAPGTLAFALATLPLVRLDVAVLGAPDLALLGSCTTLERIAVKWRGRIDNRTVWTETCGGLAAALPKLVRLAEFKFVAPASFRDALLVLAAWELAPSARRVDIRSDCEADIVPAVSGPGTTDLRLDGCGTAYLERLLRRLHSLERLAAENLFLADDAPTRVLGAAIRAGYLAGYDRLRSVALRGCCRRGIAMGLATLSAMWRSCPRLAELELDVHSSFDTPQLAAFLELAADRLEVLQLFYSWAGKTRAIRIDDDPAHSAAKSAARAHAMSLPPDPIVLPRLRALNVSMCDDRLVRRLRCPLLEVLSVLGARAEVRDVAHLLGAFPRLESLGLRVWDARFTAGDVRCESLRCLTLAWNFMDHDDMESLGVAPATITANWRRRCPPAVTRRYGLTGDAVVEILERCPNVDRLAVGGTAVAAFVVQKLARCRHESALTSLSILDEADAWDVAARVFEVGPLADAFARMRARHPRLLRVAMPLAGLDPQLGGALAGLQLSNCHD